MEMSHMAPRKLLVTSCWSWYLPRGRHELVGEIVISESKGCGQTWVGKETRPFAEVEPAAMATQISLGDGRCHHAARLACHTVGPRAETLCHDLYHTIDVLFELVK